MSAVQPADGSTPLTPQEQVAQQQKGMECMGRWKHYWIWEDLLVMKVCPTCGARKPFIGLNEGQ